MRKLRIFPALAAVAMLAIPSVASADVPRCEASVPVNTTVTTATFTWTEPANVAHQFENVWTHNETVIVTGNSFEGTGVQDGTDANGTQHFTESITGSFGGSPLGSTVSFVTQRNDGVSHSVTNAPTDGSLVIGTATAPTFTVSIDMHIATPVFTTATTTTVGTESVKNHGQYVKALGGGKVPAQACAGMPLVSTQGS